MSKFQPPERTWLQKFGDSFRGLGFAIWNESSFWIHLPVGVGVMVVGGLLGAEVWEMLILAICFGWVITMELLNTSVELVARKVTDEESELIRNSLDIASGAVLCSVLFSSTIGLWIVVPKIVGLF